MDPHSVDAGPRAGLTADAAARLLLQGYWTKGLADELDRFHWQIESGLHYVSDLRSIASAVWGAADDADADEEEGMHCERPMNEFTFSGHAALGGPSRAAPAVTIAPRRACRTPADETASDNDRCQSQSSTSLQGQGAWERDSPARRPPTFASSSQLRRTRWPTTRSGCGLLTGHSDA